MGEGGRMMLQITVGWRVRMTPRFPDAEGTSYHKEMKADKSPLALKAQTWNKIFGVIPQSTSGWMKSLGHHKGTQLWIEPGKETFIG
jgi:hypothetical protein